ncbi:MAG: WD40 repeat domain-containing protein [Treponema sp.]|jgi:WD40 repeat protein|nr:WD40 repeat domain-containing protein [Treponema sp.]
MRYINKNFVCIFLNVLFTASFVSAQSRNTTSQLKNAPFIPGGHRGMVKALAYDGNGEVLSAGADGFIEIWDLKKYSASERFQISALSLTSMVIRPGKPQIAVAESDGLGLYRISVWDYRTKQNLFTLQFRDPISYISYSGGGNFLIVGRNGRTGVVFIDPETGAVLRSPEKLTGQVTFAATSPSEKTMITYLLTGTLSYWELESGNELRRLNVPAGINSPVLFGNNRFLAGFSGGLVILDAVNGNVLVRDRNIGGGTLMQADPDAPEFICLSSSGQTPVLTHFVFSRNSTLVVKNQRTVSTSIPAITCAAITSNSAVLGTADGSVWNFSQQGRVQVFTVKNQKQILEGAASGGVLGFLTEDNRLAFIPLNYQNLGTDSIIHLENGDNFTRISSDTSREPGAAGIFMLWQTANTRTFPLIRTIPAPHPAGRAPPASVDNSGMPEKQGRDAAENGSSEKVSDIVLNRLSLRFPLRSAVIHDNRTLFLDSVGNITAININTGRIQFSYTSVGSMDAAFIDGANIIIGRSAISGNTPFLMINISNGETVPLAYPSAIGAKVLQGRDNTIYGAVVDQDGGISTTTLIRLNTLNPSFSTRLVEYQGEDTIFAFAESGGNLAFSLGGDGAAIYNSQTIIPFERSSGLPFKLIDGINHFISIDTEGNICWHNPRTGSLEAFLRLYEDEWILEKTGVSMIRGNVERTD